MRGLRVERSRWLVGSHAGLGGLGSNLASSKFFCPSQRKKSGNNVVASLKKEEESLAEEYKGRLEQHIGPTNVN